MKDIEKTLFLTEVGNRIRTEREYLGMTREKFAEIVDLSPFYIGQIERGDRSMSIGTLIKISNSLKVSIDYLLKGRNYDINQFISLDSLEKYYEKDIPPEIQGFLDTITKFPKDKLNLIIDITKLILPHIK